MLKASVEKQHAAVGTPLVFVFEKTPPNSDVLSSSLSSTDKGKEEQIEINELSGELKLPKDATK